MKWSFQSLTKISHLFDLSFEALPAKVRASKATCLHDYMFKPIILLSPKFLMILSKMATSQDSRYLGFWVLILKNCSYMGYKSLVVLYCVLLLYRTINNHTIGSRGEWIGLTDCVCTTPANPLSLGTLVSYS